MDRKKIRFGIIGLGLMGKEFGSAVARWCHLDANLPVPVITAVCDNNNQKGIKWFTDNFPSIELNTNDYKELLLSDKVDAVYVAVPHHLHEKIYLDVLHAGKHLFGEKPFGIDINANSRIVSAINEHPGLIVRCSSEFPYFPGARKITEWIREKKYGRIIEVRAGFHHSSDMDLEKSINWKRMIEYNGEYGCMGDLGLHTMHIPFRVGWIPISVSADLQKIAETRPDGKGNRIPCETWDNAVLTCKCKDPDSRKEFSMVLETKRMAPGQMNTWFIEVYGTEGSAKFSTRDPKTFWSLETTGREQGWTRTDLGSQSYIPSITGGIFEFGFSDAFQQMIGALMNEFTDSPDNHKFRCVSVEETALSHRLLTAAIESHSTGRKIMLN